MLGIDSTDSGPKFDSSLEHIDNPIEQTLKKELRGTRLGKV